MKWGLGIGWRVGLRIPSLVSEVAVRLQDVNEACKELQASFYNIKP